MEKIFRRIRGEKYMEYKLININKLKTNTYNPNEMTEDVYTNLKEEITRVGFIAPVIVRKETEEYIIIDGEHRFKVAKNLDYEEIPCIVTNLTELEAKTSTINLNKIKGITNPIKFAKLLQDLESNLNQEELKRIFNISTEELEAYKELLNMPDMMPEITFTEETITRENIDKDKLATLTLTQSQVKQLKKQFQNLTTVEILRKVSWFYIEKEEI